jgi:7-carboxy-7-deazaguanine synthase
VSGLPTVGLLVAEEDQSQSVRARKFPIVELFGPTLQGEGALAGRPTHFVRFAACDFRCLWCDSSHAVLPEQFKAVSTMFTAEEIIAGLQSLPGTPHWVTLSGGNPGLQRLGELVDLLHAAGYDVAIETQGTTWQSWMTEVDMLTVSPKPPSSGMVNDDLLEFLDQESLARALHTAEMVAAERGVGASRKHFHREYSTVLKVPIWDSRDYEFARRLHAKFKSYPFYLSVVTAMGGLYGDFDGGRVDTRDDILNRYRWLAEKVAAEPIFADVAALPQLHALVWPVTERGH